MARAYGALSLAVKAALVAVFAVLTTGIGIAMVVWIPADYFKEARANGTVWWRRHPVLYASGLVVKNVVGILFVIVGGIMALPLVPGPGLLFILLGFSALDFPGKRKIELRLLAVPSVLRSLNGIRAAFKRPPLVIEAPRDPAAKAAVEEKR